MSNKASVKQKAQGSAPQKDGKKSIKEIHSELGFAPAEEAFKTGVDELEIDPELKKELDQKDLVHRFINFKNYKTYGFHKNHWVPYKRDSKPRNSIMFNLDPNGFMTKGDLVLAVKPRDWNEMHKKTIQEANKRKEGVIKQKTKEFRNYASSAGIGATVVEGDE